MVIFSPSNARNPQGNPTLRNACEREYCYCEHGCLIGTLPDIPGTITREEADAEEWRVVVDFDVSAIGSFGGDLLHVFAGTDNTQNLNIGIRFTLSRPGSTYIWSLFEDGVLLASRSWTVDPSRIFICVKENGEASGTIASATGTEQITVAGKVSAATGTILGVQTIQSGWVLTGIDWYQIRTSILPQCPPCPLVGCTVCPNFPVSLEAWDVRIQGVTDQTCTNCASANNVWMTIGSDALTNCTGFTGGSWDCLYTEYARNQCELDPNQWIDSRCGNILCGFDPSQIVTPALSVGQFTGDRAIWALNLNMVDCVTGTGQALWRGEQITDDCNENQLNTAITGDRLTGWERTDIPVLGPCDFSTLSSIEIRRSGGAAFGGAMGAMLDPNCQPEMRRGKPVIPKGRKRG